MLKSKKAPPLFRHDRTLTSNGLSMKNLATKRTGDGIPFNLKMDKRLGKGSNNSVYLCECVDNNASYAIRIPRRGSDTQKLKNAEEELRLSVLAADHRLAPQIYDAWYNKHASQEQPSGLHIIQEYFPHTMSSFLTDDVNVLLEKCSAFATIVESHLRQLAKLGILSHDLKLGNLVARIPDKDSESSIDVRFIDFGKDFCEHLSFRKKEHIDETSPTLTELHRIVNKVRARNGEETEDVYTHVLFCAMLIILTVNIHSEIEYNKYGLRMNSKDREKLNFLVPVCQRVRAATPGRYVKAVKALLRQPALRENMCHYIGRRNSGTRRLFVKSQFMLPASKAGRNVHGTNA